MSMNFNLSEIDINDLDFENMGSWPTPAKHHRQLWLGTLHMTAIRPFSTLATTASALCLALACSTAQAQNVFIDPVELTVAPGESFSLSLQAADFTKAAQSAALPEEDDEASFTEITLDVKH